MCLRTAVVDSVMAALEAAKRFAFFVRAHFAAAKADFVGLLNPKEQLRAASSWMIVAGFIAAFVVDFGYLSIEETT